MLGLVFDESVVKEWVKDKIEDGIFRLRSVEHRLQELKKIAAGKEG